MNEFPLINVRQAHGLTTLRQLLDAVVDDEEPLTLTRDGKPIAVVLPIAEYERLRSLT